MNRTPVLLHLSRRLLPGIVILFLLLGTIMVRAAAAPEPFSTKFRSGNDITIPAGETITHDLYLTGNNVRVDGKIDGDLVVAGGTVIVNGTVSGAVLAAGGTVTLNGTIGRQARVAGGTITLGGPIGGDLVAAGGQMTATGGSHVAGDLAFAGGTLALNGAVDGGVLGSASQYTKTGTIGGAEQVTIQQNDAKTKAPPSVWSQVRPQIERYAIFLLFAVLLLWLVPRLLRAATETAETRPLPSLGIGFVTFIAAVVLVFALFVVMLALAIPLGLLGLGQLAGIVVVAILIAMVALIFAIAVFSAFVADALVGLVVGRVLLERIAQPWARQPFWQLLIGVTAIFLLTVIPFVGGLIQFLVIIAAAGILASQVIQRRRAGVTTPVSLPPVGPLGTATTANV